MARKRPVIRFPKPKALSESHERSWHNGGDIEIDLYARSLHSAAKSLIADLDLQPKIGTAWNACPVVMLYRQAVELRVKALVGAGNNFLPSPTDSITLCKTHSLRWLAQIVCQIIKKVRWEDEFKCECVGSLADFTAIVNELEDLDPVSIAVQSSRGSRDGSAPPQLQAPNVVRFARKLDALLDLLGATADALAAAWDSGRAGATDGDLVAGTGFTPTIQ